MILKNTFEWLMEGVKMPRLWIFGTMTLNLMFGFLIMCTERGWGRFR